MRTELTFVVFRGRVCGNTDEGRVFFLPYRQIDFLQINRAVKEAEIRQLFGESESPRSGLVAPPPGSALGLTIPVPPKSGLHIVAAPGSSPQVIPLAPQIPAAALRPPGPRPILPVSRVPTAPAAAHPAGSTLSNVPAAALIPPGGAGNGSIPPAPPRNSILERLRAQRNAILPPRPPGR